MLMQNHVVIIGWNMIGKIICEEFQRRGVQFIVLTPPEPGVDTEALSSSGIPNIPCAPEEMEETLMKAGIPHARAACILYEDITEIDDVVNTIKRLKPDLKLITYSGLREDQPKFKDMGIEDVIQSYAVVGCLMAASIHEPKVADFILNVLREHRGLDVDQLEVNTLTTLDKIQIDPDEKPIVIYQKTQRKIVFPPEETLTKGDTVLVLRKSDEPLLGGRSYLVLEEAPQRSMLLFTELINKNLPGLCIARTHPEMLKTDYGMFNADALWLSDTEPGEAVCPPSLPKITTLVSEFIKSKADCVILLEGLEYLIVQNNFQQVLRFVQKLNSFVCTSNARLIVPVDPKTLEERELRLLARELIVL
jgi:voltage-gated potassium channel Kch